VGEEYCSISKPDEKKGRDFTMPTFLCRLRIQTTLSYFFST